METCFENRQLQKFVLQPEQQLSNKWHVCSGIFLSLREAETASVTTGFCSSIIQVLTKYLSVTEWSWIPSAAMCPDLSFTSKFAITRKYLLFSETKYIRCKWGHKLSIPQRHRDGFKLMKMLPSALLLQSTQFLRFYYCHLAFSSSSSLIGLCAIEE